MRCLVLSGPGRLELAELPDPLPGPEEVLIAVGGSGICGTDRHLLEGDHPHVRYPVVPGHEMFGRVVAVGAGVAALRPGMRVAVNPSVACNDCPPCLGGRPNLCDRKGGYGIARNGGFAELAVVDQRYCHVLPASVSDTLAVLAEPLACAVHAVDRLGPVLGARALVLGAGPIGLLMAALLGQAGTASVGVVDINAERAATARRVTNLPVAASVSEVGPAGQWDIVVEATGSPAAVEQGFSLLAKGGRLLVMGVTPSDASARIPLAQLLVGERAIIASFSLMHSFGRAIELLASGRLDVERIVTDRVPLEEFERAIAQLGDPAHLKTVVTPALADRGQGQ